MKVLHVINSLEIGGAEKLIVDGFEYYLKNGVDIDLVILKQSDVSFEQFLPANVAVTYLTKGTVYNPLLIFKLIRCIRRYRIVHAHLFPTLYWVVLAKLLSGTKSKIVYTEHNTYNRRRSLLLFTLLDRFIYNFVSFVGCISIATRTNLIKHLKVPADSSTILTILNGLDLQKFENNKQLDFSYFPSSLFKLIQVSSFTKQKDQSTLIRALKLLPNEIVLLLVGDGELIHKSKKLVKDLDLESRVIFTGIRTDVPELVRYSDVSVLSSHYEGFGLAVLEGMASRKPSIACNIPGVSEIVEGAGLLFEKGNENELASKVLSLHRSQDLYNETAEKCYQRASEYDINKMVKQYIEVYKKIS